MSTEETGAVSRETKRIAYADPPYPGCAHLYRDHPDYAGEVNHYLLAERLADEYDGFVSHSPTSSIASARRCRSATAMSA